MCNLNTISYFLEGIYNLLLIYSILPKLLLILLKIIILIKINSLRKSIWAQYLNTIHYNKILYSYIKIYYLKNIKNNLKTHSL